VRPPAAAYPVVHGRPRARAFAGGRSIATCVAASADADGRPSHARRGWRSPVGGGG
jgi:hypothetical protein